MSYQKIAPHKYRIFAYDKTNEKTYTKTLTTKLKGNTLKRYMEERETQLLAEKRKAINDHKRGLGTYKDLCYYWLNLKERASKTIESYTLIIERSIAYLGADTPPQTITPVDIHQLLLHLETTYNLKAKSLRNHYAVYRAIFNFAVRFEVLTTSPVSKVDPPTYHYEINTDQYYTEEEIGQLLIALESEPTRNQLATLLSLFVGLRRGELMALRFGDLNLHTHEITIERSLTQTTHAGAEIKGTKTHGSTRTIAYPDCLDPFINTLREAENIKKKSTLWKSVNLDPANDYLFTRDDGSPLHVSTFYQWWIRFTKRHQLRYIKWHGLRHTSATYLLSTGTNIVNLSQRLGHTRASTTYIYTHALHKTDQEAAAKFNNAYKNLTKNLTRDLKNQKNVPITPIQKSLER